MIWTLASIFWHKRMSKAVTNSLKSEEISKLPLSKPLEAAGGAILDSGILVSTARYPEVTW